MRHSVAPGIVLVAVVVLLVVATAPGAAHTDHAEADAQVSANGTLVVEWVFSDLDGWLVVRADDVGEPGDAIGHRRLPSDGGFRTDQTVAIDEASWTAQEGARTVWVVLHREADGEGFDPEDDPAVTVFDSVAGSRITVEKADRPARVTAQEFGPQSANDGTVTLRRVELPEAGFVALHASAADIPTKAADEDIGEVLGTTSLEAGVHRNVTVELDESFVAANNETRVVQAVLYRGTDSFEATTTTPITAGGSTVSTGFGLDSPPEDNEGNESVADEGIGITTPSTTSTATSEEGTGFGAFFAVLVLLGTGVTVTRRWRD